MSVTVSPPAPAHALAVRLDGVSKVFPGPVAAVSPMSFAVGAGEFLALLGPSGCGKSTLLRLIAGLDVPTGGSVTVTVTAGGGEAAGLAYATPRRRRRTDVAFVFQDAHLLPWRSVLRNVALPLELMGVSRGERKAAALHALEQVGLADAVRRFPAQLSGGMRMRVSLARALVTNPKLLLLDEPFAALDEITRQKLDDLLRELWLTRRMTTLFVTHSIQEAAYLARRVIVFTKRPAAVILDRVLELPEARTPVLRTEQRFAKEAHVLFEALQRAGEVP